MPSLLRATVMILVGGTAVLLDRDREPLNLLALSGHRHPPHRSLPGVQPLVPALVSRARRHPRRRRPGAAAAGGQTSPRFSSSAFAMSAGAQVATLPLVIGALRRVVSRPASWPSLLLVPLDHGVSVGRVWPGCRSLPVPGRSFTTLCPGLRAVLRGHPDVRGDALARVPGLDVPAGRRSRGWPREPVCCAGCCLGAPRWLPRPRRRPVGEGRRVNSDSPAEIRALLEERGLALKKRWGQNFLVNRGRPGETRGDPCSPSRGRRCGRSGPGSVP